MSAFPPPQLKYKLGLVKLQQHRLSRISLWRSCLLICWTIGLGLAIALLNLQIEQQNQIEIEGITLVSENTVYQTLAFPYPKYVWAVNGIDITKQIESIPSVKTAQVKRQIFPPGITISLQEKVPVAIATSYGQVGFLDIKGEWIAQKFYAALNTNYPLPELKVINYQTQFRQAWIEMYQLISSYPDLQISEVHWHQAGNLFVQTKIGRIFLGSDSSRLKQQFKIMSKLKNLPAQLAGSEIAYIDLSNSKLNLIQRY